MLLREKCFPREVGIAIVESWKKEDMSQCQDGRSVPSLLVGQRAGKCTSTAWPAITHSTQSAEMTDVLGNTLKARSRRSVAVQELHHAFDKRVAATMIMPNWHLFDFTN